MEDPVWSKSERFNTAHNHDCSECHSIDAGPRDLKILSNSVHLATNNNFTLAGMSFF